MINLISLDWSSPKSGRRSLFVLVSHLTQGPTLYLTWNVDLHSDFLGEASSK